MAKLQNLPSEKDRSRLQHLEEQLRAAVREREGGKGGARFLDASERLGRLYNSTAMQYLQAGTASPLVSATRCPVLT